MSGYVVNGQVVWKLVIAKPGLQKLKEVYFFLV